MAKYIQHPETGKLVPAEEYVRPRSKSAYVMEDIKPFVSPVDGTVISSRPHLEAHNRRHGVTNSADYSKEYLKSRADQRVKQQTREGRQERVNLIRSALERAGV